MEEKNEKLFAVEEKNEKNTEIMSRKNVNES